MTKENLFKKMEEVVAGEWNTFDEVAYCAKNAVALSNEYAKQELLHFVNWLETNDYEGVVTSLTPEKQVQIYLECATSSNP